MSAIAVVASDTDEGCADGRHGCTGRGSASRSVSKTTESSSVPETPSTMAWWVFETSAQ